MAGQGIAPLHIRYVMCTLDENKNVHPCRAEGYVAWVKTFPGDSVPEQEINAIKFGYVGDHEIGRWRVSTRCMFVDVDPFDGPKWFETMVFKDGSPTHQIRYETWQQAQVGHNCALQSIRDGVVRYLNGEKPC